MAKKTGKAAAVRKYLEALAALSKEHGFKIGGCGECGSPWVIDMKEGRRGSPNHVEHLYWCASCDKYGAYNDHSNCPIR